MVFNRNKKLGEPIATAVVQPVPPTIVERLEGELRKTEEQIRFREDEIKALNVRAAELAGQVAWLKRTPQAVLILTALAGRLTQ